MVFIIVFVIFLLTLYILLILYSEFHLEVFQSKLFRIWYWYWYFHGQYITNGFGTNEISYYIFDLRHIISCRLLDEKQDVHIFTQVSKQRKWKNIKKRDCRAVFRTLSNICNGPFLQNYNGQKIHHRCLIWL